MMRDLVIFHMLGAGALVAAMSALSCGNAPSPAPAADEGLAGTVTQPLRKDTDDTRNKFEMVRSTAATNAGCLPDAHARVRIESLGPVEVMNVDVFGLPPNTDFDFFVIQVPDTPFGLSWYQGDIETDRDGRGRGKFIGRFNVETFIVAPGVAPAPVVFDKTPFPDVDTNPQTGPVHTYHLGLWFNAPADAVAAGCPGATTPFNGEHNAGSQVLSTRNFEPDEGPLRQVK
jgi:hypothetical protein